MPPVPTGPHLPFCLGCASAYGVPHILFCMGTFLYLPCVLCFHLEQILLVGGCYATCHCCSACRCACVTWSAAACMTTSLEAVYLLLCKCCLQPVASACFTYMMPPSPAILLFGDDTFDPGLEWAGLFFLTTTSCLYASVSLSSVEAFYLGVCLPGHLYPTHFAAICPVCLPTCLPSLLTWRLPWRRCATLSNRWTTMQPCMETTHFAEVHTAGCLPFWRLPWRWEWESSAAFCIAFLYLCLLFPSTCHLLVLLQWRFCSSLPCIPHAACTTGPR
jgi:hypothetical protein